MRKFMLLLAIFSFIGLQIFAQRTVTGTVTDDAGEPLPGVSVNVKNTTVGTMTLGDGTYSIDVPEGSNVLVFSYIGMEIQEVEVDGTVVNVVMQPSQEEIGEVVVTALGIEREEKTLSYASQNVDSEELNVTSESNIKTAITGKVAGVQEVGQAGSKLGASGRLRIRGAVSLTSDGDPLYVVDGVPITDPNIIDMENVESVNVLKGPNATALYGQRAEYGVIMITSKTAKKGRGIAVEINSNTTFDVVSYLPNYQDEYGAGYDGDLEWEVYDASAWYAQPEWAAFDGERFIYSGYADESWGPKFDGQPYVAWYNWWPESPYYEQTATWEAHPDNIKNFYDTGITMKNSIAVSGAGDDFSARIGYTNLDQKGIMPFSTFKKNTINANFQYDASKNLNISMNVNYFTSEVNGDFDDGYSNQTTGSFNSWFNRNIDMDKMWELKDLKTTNGYHASWNFWNPIYSTAFGTENGAFWYNPYFWLEHMVNTTNNERFMGIINVTYNLLDKVTLTAKASTSTRNWANHYEKPYIISNSSDPALYNEHNNGFGNDQRRWVDNNYALHANYKDNFGDFDVDVFAGAEVRTAYYRRFAANMPTESATDGLTFPDVYVYSNTWNPVTPVTWFQNKTVFSMFTRASVGYKNMAYLEGTYRRDHSSALLPSKNGYGYPSVGATFIFSELIPDKTILSFGKFRASYAKIGSDVGALTFNRTLPISGSPYLGRPGMYTDATLVDPNIVVPFNTSMEVGIDLKFLKNRAGLAFTYFYEKREQEIIGVSLSTATGWTTYLTNAGLAVRDGIELTLEGTPVKIDNFEWNVMFNLGTSNPVVKELPEGLESMDAPGGSDDWLNVQMTHEIGPWGQLKGRAIARDANGNAIINSVTGTYEFETGHYYGSVIPDFTGGLLNNFKLFDMVNISAHLAFQKGGKFFSLTEMWGAYSGLLEETAVDGIREDGVLVEGVDENGDTYSDYLDAVSYFAQFQDNVIPEPYIHDASYLKLKEVAVTFNLPKKWFDNLFIRSANIGFVGRNLWLIAVAEDNVHGWDPSELSQPYGENAQLPGIKSYGFNIKLTF